MSPGVRLFISIPIAVLVAVILWLAEYDVARGREPARWFVPGAIGFEPASFTTVLPKGGGAAAVPLSVVSKSRSGRLSAENRVPVTNNRQAITDNRASGFETRAFSGLRTPAEREWARKNALTEPLPFSHNLNNVFPSELYKTHPEFFPLVGGRRLEPPKGSYFWNPDIAREDVAEFAADAARRYFEKHPKEVSFALGVNDALIWGESRELLALLRERAEGGGRRTEDRRPEDRAPNAWFRGRPDYSNVVFTFMNRAAEELSRTHPDKYLGCLAYYWCENVPNFPLHSRVVPFLTADRAQGYDAGFWKEELELQRKWGRTRGWWSVVGGQLSVVDDWSSIAGNRAPSVRSPSPETDRTDNREPTANHRKPAARRLGLYDYLFGAGFLIPRIHTTLVAEHLRHARRAGFTDYYAQLEPNWGLDPVTPWLTAQLLQNPEQSRDALLEEFYRRYFREAAAPMRRFFESCEELWMAQSGPPYWLKHFRNESQAIIFPRSVVRELRGYLESATSLARSNRVRERVRLVSETFGVTERLLEFKDVRDRLSRLSVIGDRLSLVGVISRKRRSETLGLDSSGATLVASTDHGILELLTDYIASRRDFIRYTIALRTEQPLALHQVNYDDFVRNNPGFAAAVRWLEVSGGAPAVRTTLRGWGESWLHAAVAYHDAKADARIRELLPAGSLEGPWVPGRRIAGLQYGVDMPGPWQSRLEPTQTHEALLSTSAARSGAAGLRMSGAVNSTVYQWVPITGGRTLVASVFARATVSPGHAAMLTLGWLDAQHRHLGTPVTIRIPDGEWTEWIQLLQGAKAPENAAWAGIGIRVQNQLPGDFVEFDDFSLVEVIP